MPIFRDIPLTLELNQALCRQGIPEPAKASPRVRALLRELLADAGIRSLLQPAIAYNTHVIERIEGGMLLHNGVAFSECRLPRSWRSARHIIAAVGTIGPKLEEEVARLFADKEPLRAVVLDSLGNAALDPVTRKARELATDLASGYGYQATSPIFPGDADFPLDEQPAVVHLAGAEEIGVHLTPSGMMSPLKTISMIMALGPGVATATVETPCDRCNLAKSCHYRSGESVTGAELGLESFRGGYSL